MDDVIMNGCPRHCRQWKTLLFFSALLLLEAAFAGSSVAAQSPQWIWAPDHTHQRVPEGSCYFRKAISATGMVAGYLTIAADDSFEVYWNGRKVSEGSGWREPQTYNLSKLLRPGANVLAIKVTNTEGNTAGLAATIRMKHHSGRTITHVSDKSWRTTLRPLLAWHMPLYADGRWPTAQSFGSQGRTQPWVADSAQLASDAFAEAQAIAPESDNTTAGITPSQTVSNTNDEPASDTVDTVEGAGASAPAAAGNHPLFRTLPDFEVQVLAGHKNTGSLIAVEFNEFGELLLSQEGGPLLIMVDSDKDKLPDKIRIYCDRVKNVQGILPLNGEVFVTADGPNGAALYRLSDKNKDGKLEVADALIKFEGSLGEHGPHTVLLGPDGYLYVLVGNHGKIETEISKNSPYGHIYEGDIVQRFEDPGGHAVGIKAPGGVVLRTSIAGGRVERVAGGLRNPYDMAFDRWGNLLTHESDMESDEGSPWYRPTHISHIVPGGEYGWRSGWAKWPTYWHDGLPAAVSTGRGSPTGIVCYEHFMFPEEFQHDLFVCDWTNGRILSVEMTQQGASLSGKSEVFIEGSPLNVTDMAVGEDGWLYFVTGGRQTEGGVYRIIYNGETPDAEKKIGTGVAAAIRYPQVHSAWARQDIAKIKKTVGPRWNAVMPAVARTKKNSAHYRVRALDVMQLFGPPPNSTLLMELTTDDEPLVRAKAVDLMSLGSRKEYEARLTEMLEDKDPTVRRRVCEAMIRLSIEPAPHKLMPLLVSQDRFEAFAARRLLERVPVQQWQDEVLTTKNHREFIQGSTALMIAKGDKETALRVLRRLQGMLGGFVSDDDFIDMLRVAQLAIEAGEITSEDAPQLTQDLADEFPSSHKIMNRELLRLLINLQVTDIADRYIAYLHSGLDAPEQLWVALHLGLLPANWTPQQRTELLKVLEEVADRKAGPSVRGYVQNVTRQFAGTLSDEQRRQVLKNGVAMPNAALSVLFHLPEKPDLEILGQLRSLYGELEDKELPGARQLRIGIVAVMGNSADDESMEFLRELYPKQPHERPFIAMALAQRPGGDNWSVLIDSLQYLDGNAAGVVLKSLERVQLAPEEFEPYRQVILCGLKSPEATGAQAASLMQHWTGEALNSESKSAEKNLQAWQAWFAQKWPDKPEAVLSHSSTGSRWSLENLMANLPSFEGSPHRGEIVYEKAQCAKCHQFGGKGEALGPDLSSIARRFRTQEILQSVLYPSQVVSDQYRAQTVITTDGRSLTGIVTQGGEGELIVLDSTGRRLILKKDEVEETTPSKISSMPEGLLDNLSTQDIADLMSYLTTPPQLNVTIKPAENDTR